MSTIKVNSIQNTSGVELYTAKAWVNFNGTGTVAIRASGNVSSITDNGVGDYTINMASAMPDTNFSVVGTHGASSSTGWVTDASPGTARTTTSVRIGALNSAGTAGIDTTFMNVVIFR